MAPKKNITVIDNGCTACNETCATIMEKGLPQDSIWLYLNHLVQNIEYEQDLTKEQQETISELFDKYLTDVADQNNSELIQQQGLYFLEELRQIRNSQLEGKIKEEQFFIKNLLLTISRHLEKLYESLHSQETTTIIETFKHDTIIAIREAPNKESIIQLVEASFDKVNLAVENNLTTIKDSIECMMNLESKTLLDILTGLYNRRFFDQVLPKIVKAFLRHKGKKPFSILAIDIDNFKQVNDTYGHLIGDAALQHVAHIIQTNCRGGVDSPIRMGGDEFILFLIGTNQTIATQKAEKILAEIVKKPLYFSQQDRTNKNEKIALDLTVSIGVCELDYGWNEIPAKELISSILNPSKEMEGHKKLTLKLVESADKALYEAKQQGRNRVCVHTSN